MVPIVRAATAMQVSADIELHPFTDRVTNSFIYLHNASRRFYLSARKIQMKYFNTRVVFRVLALCVALVGAFGLGKLQGGFNLFLWLGAVFSLLAFGEFESKDITQKLKIKTMTSLRLQSTWLGKLFELCSFFAYAIYIGAQILSK